MIRKKKEKVQEEQAQEEQAQEEQPVVEEKKTASNYPRWVCGFAFFALALAALLLLTGPIIDWILKETDSTGIKDILNMVSQYCLLAAIALPGWFFVRHKRIGWKIAFFIFLTVYVAGTICGITISIK